MKKREYCGAEFEPQRGKRFCTPNCATRARHGIPIKQTKNCVVCGAEFMPRKTNQVTCGKPECKRTYSRKRVYRYKKPGNEKVVVQKKKKRYTAKEWENLTPSQRWELMTWKELSAELARLHLTYGQAQVLKERRELPFDFGERCRK